MGHKNLTLEVVVGHGVEKKKRSVIPPLVEALVRFAKSRLFPRHKVQITVELRKFGGLEHDISGWCNWDEDNVRPRSFVLEVNTNQNIDAFIKTVLHEMVHVKQYVTDELKERYLPRRKLFWKGADHSSTKVSEAPWEIEAYYMEEVLYHEYQEYLNSSQEK